MSRSASTRTLQDDISAIEAMIDAHGQGNDVVYGVRSSRAKDSVFKRSSAEAYYRLLALFGVRIVPNHADYRLLSRRALESLKQYSEVNLFQRGIIPLLGYRSTIVYYKRGNVSPGRPRPNMRFVPIKNVVQQGVLALHRVRQGFVKARTAQASQIRELLAEFGVVIPQRITQLFAKMPEVLEDATNELPGSVRALMRRLLGHLKEVDRQAKEAEAPDHGLAC